MCLQSLANNADCLYIPHRLWKGIPQLGGSIFESSCSKALLVSFIFSRKTKTRLRAGTKRTDWSVHRDDFSRVFRGCSLYTGVSKGEELLEASEATDLQQWWHHRVLSLWARWRGRQRKRWEDNVWDWEWTWLDFTVKEGSHHRCRAYKSFISPYFLLSSVL